GADRFSVRVQSRRAGDPGAIPLPAASDVHVPRLAGRAHHGDGPAVRPLAGGIPRGSWHAAGGLRLWGRDGGKRAAAPGRLGLHEEGDAGRVLGADHLGGGDLPLSISLVAPPHRPPRANRSNRGSPRNGSHSGSRRSSWGEKHAGIDKTRSMRSRAVRLSPASRYASARFSSTDGPSRASAPRGSDATTRAANSIACARRPNPAYAMARALSIELCTWRLPARGSCSSSCERAESNCTRALPESPSSRTVTALRT